LLAGAFYDVRFAARMLLWNPGFTIVALLTLAVGVGAVTSVFCVVNALLLRPLPYDPDSRLVNVWQTYDSVSASNFETPRMQRSRTAPSLGTLEELQRVNRSFDHMGFYESKPGVALLDPPPAEHIQPLEATPDFFAMFDTVPALGRLFGPADRAARVTVISHGAWQRRFGG